MFIVNVQVITVNLNDVIVLITEIVRYHGSYTITRSLITYKFRNATSDAQIGLGLWNT